MHGVLFVREDPALLGNNIFSGQALYGMKSDNYMFQALKNRLEQLNISLDTQDILSPEKADFILCLNETVFFKAYKRKTKNQFIYLLLSEPPVYNSKDWDSDAHTPFDKVFTYDYERVDNKKYFHYTFPIDFFQQRTKLCTREEFNNMKLAVIIAGAISIYPHSRKLKSLLFDRYKVIKWYARNAANDLHFYARINPMVYCKHFPGAGFFKRYFPAILEKRANSIYQKNIQVIYKGPIPAGDKVHFLENFRFSYCFENTYGIKGLISEKIFDCFMALNVPIYFGAPDINQHIPSECYIDFKKYPNMKDLNNFLCGINYEQYIQMQENILKFITSDKIQEFSVENYCSIFLRHITADLK